MERLKSWWEKLAAIAALMGLLLSLFNLTYIPMRDVYLHYIPTIVNVYDPLKGITPHPFTEDYLQTVHKLDRTLDQQQELNAESKELLSTLREKSEEMIEDNPFLISQKTGGRYSESKAYYAASLRSKARDNKSSTSFSVFTSLTSSDVTVTPYLSANFLYFGTRE